MEWSGVECVCGWVGKGVEGGGRERGGWVGGRCVWEEEEGGRSAGGGGGGLIFLVVLLSSLCFGWCCRSPLLLRGASFLRVVFCFSTGKVAKRLLHATFHVSPPVSGSFVVSLAEGGAEGIGVGV